MYKPFSLVLLLFLLLAGCDVFGSNDEEERGELVIEDLTVGTGAEAKLGDTLTVHYVGTLEDGTVFDSSRARGMPFIFPLGGNIIDGWNEGLPGMRIGGVRKLTVPPHLGFGNRWRGTVPPNSTLIFEVELLEIGLDGELIVEDSTVGTGEEAQLGDTLTVHYVGTLANGSVFDSSRERGTPFIFILGGNVIDGWNEGLPGMRVGGIRKLTIPPQLAYGGQANGPIPPFATLFFEVELLAIGTPTPDATGSKAGLGTPFRYPDLRPFPSQPQPIFQGFDGAVDGPDLLHEDLALPAGTGLVQ